MTGAGGATGTSGAAGGKDVSVDARSSRAKLCGSFPLVFRKTGSGIRHTGSSRGFGAVVLRSSFSIVGLFPSSVMLNLLLQIKYVGSRDDPRHAFEIFDKDGRCFLQLRFDLAQARIHLDDRETVVHYIANLRLKQ